MSMSRTRLRLALTGCALVAGLGLARVAIPEMPSGALLAADVPAFEVVRGWPKPLPNNWTLGPVSGITVDVRDHVWVTQRGEPVKQAGKSSAPAVLEFDPEGNLVQAWGAPGPGYEWLEQVHGISIDARSRVWITGNGEKDAHILAFSPKGEFLSQIGRSGMSKGNNDTVNVGRATQARLDALSGELFVSDGERSPHRRVIVFDAESGTYRRHWGAYGERPEDSEARARFDPNGPPPREFVDVHCLHLDRDRVVYVCDRNNSRIQLFTRDGKFLREKFIVDGTTTRPSVWDLAFSPDQQHVYVADGSNQKVWILQREGLDVVGSFGSAGSDAGQFATNLHTIAVDSKGNIYTGEAATAGRMQKFALKADEH